MLRSPLVFTFALALLGCTTAVSTQRPDSGGDGGGEDGGGDGGEVVAEGNGEEAGEGGAAKDEDGGEDSGGERARPAGPELPSGSLCDTSADCRAGQICEGVGCEAGAGRCVPSDRMCTRDLAEYCGCDGQTFSGSGSCPGARYAYSGACEPGREDGEACTDGRQCRSGQCLGEGLEGCGRSAQGVCGQSACTKDLATYCSCNATEFRASGSCPNRQFAYRGPCEGG